MGEIITAWESPPKSSQGGIPHLEKGLRHEEMTGPVFGKADSQEGEGASSRNIYGYFTVSGDSGINTPREAKIWGATQRAGKTTWTPEKKKKEKKIFGRVWGLGVKAPPSLNSKCAMA